MSKGVGTYQINSFWESGNLIFYEKQVGHTDTGDVFTIGTTAVKVGGTAQAVDFSWYATGGLSFVLSASDSSMTLLGLNVAIDGDIVIGTDDLAVEQGYYLYLDGLGGGEYLRSGTTNYLMASATTAVDIGIGGTAKVRVESAKVSIYAGVYVDIYNNLGIQGGLVVLGNTTVAYIGCSSLVCTGNATIQGADVGIAGTLTVITAINNGYDAAGGAVNMYADTTGCGAFFDPTADTNKGSFSVGAAGGSKGTDLFAYGITNGNYLQWDQSADDLLLVGTATQLGIAGTTDAASATTGSIHTAGGIGIGMALWVGTTSKLVGAITADSTLGIAGLITSTSTTGFRSNPTFVPDATRTNYALAVGSRVTELGVTMAADVTQNFDPIQMNINVIGAAPTSTSTLNGIYQQITHDTTDMPNLRLKGCDWTITTDKECTDAYVMQTELVVSGTKTSSGELMAMSALTTLGAGARTADRVLAFQAMLSGDGTAGTVVGDCIVAYIVNAGTVITTDAILELKNQSAATANSALTFDLDGTVPYAMRFYGTVSDGWTSGTGALNGADDYVLIPVRVEGVEQDLLIKAQKTWA